MSKFAYTFLNSLNEEDEGKEKLLLGKNKPTTKNKTSKVTKKKEKDAMQNSAFGKALKESLGMGLEAAPPAPEEVPAPAPEPSDEEAWKASLDKGTNPSDFDVEDNPQVKVDSSGIEAANAWIAKLEEMAEFVNGTGPESLNSKINDLELKNSVPFRGVVRREEKRITKLAENLRGLAEVFKSVVIGSKKKIHDATAPR